jgi:hypothetical protein
MTAQHTTSPKLTSIVGVALLALALAVLIVKLEQPVAQLTSILTAAGWVALDLVPNFVAAAAHSFTANAFNHLWSSSCPLQMLASLLPLHILTALA